MSKAASPTNDDAVLRAIISHFLNFGARASEDSKWFIGILPTDLRAFFRAEFIEAIKLKAGYLRAPVFDHIESGISPDGYCGAGNVPVLLHWFDPLPNDSANGGCSS